MRKLCVLLIAALIGTGALQSGHAAPPGVPHYPDLRTRVPADLNVAIENGNKVLNFSNTIYNWGDGPLELEPKNKPKNVTEASQVVYAHDAAGNTFVWSKTAVGYFARHAGHNHWHFQGLALYELFRESDGVLVRSSEKTSVCIRENATPETGAGTTLTHFGWGGPYTMCHKAATEGLRPGYGDTYTWNLAGQDLDVTGLPDGCYRLRSTADPDGLIAETDNSNNWDEIRFQLTGTAIGACA